MGTVPPNPEVERIRAEAREALKRKDVPAAYEAYERILQLNPRDGEANEQKGLLTFQLCQTLMKDAEIHLKARRFREAASLLEQILELDPNHKLARQKLRSCRKIGKEARILSVVKWFALIAILGGLFYLALFIWNSILFSEGKTALQQGELALAMEKFQAVGKTGINVRLLDRYRTLTRGLITVRELIPEHEYRRAGEVLRRDCEKIIEDPEFSDIKLRAAEQVTKALNLYNEARESWKDARLKEGEQFLKNDEFDKARRQTAIILEQVPGDARAKDLNLRIGWNEKIFAARTALANRELPEARRIALDVLKEAARGSEEAGRAEEIKKVTRVVALREKSAVRAHEGTLMGIAGARDGKWFISFSDGGELKAWDGETMAEKKADPGSGRSVWGIALSPRQDVCALAVRKTIDLYDSKNLTRIGQIAGLDPNRPVLAVAFSPTGTFLACGAEGEARLWDMESAGAPKAVFTGTGKVSSLSFSADDRFLAAAGEDSILRIFDVPGGQPIKSIEEPGQQFISCAFQPGRGEFLAAGTVEEKGGRLVLYSTKSWEKYKEHFWKEKVYSLAFSSEGEYLAAGGSQGTIRVYETQKFNLVCEQRLVEAERDQINGLVWLGSARLLTGAKHHLRLWEPLE